MQNKKKILWISEATCLNTGFGKISQEILNRLYKSGKYEIAEVGAYIVQSDQRLQAIPWKVYATMPEANDNEGWQRYKTNSTAQFGSDVFDKALLDFQPDICVGISDQWMQSFIGNSPFKNYFKWIYMHPTDSGPPKDDWEDTFRQADVVLAYAQYGKDVLEKQYGRFLKDVKIVRPGVNHEIFKPLNKSLLRKKYGLREDMNILLTVMRNQRRKLFPDLLDAFALFLRKCHETGRNELANKTYLHLHTSYPDVGFDIPKHILRNGLSHKVLMTYACSNCGAFYPDYFQSEITICKNCRSLAAKMTNTQAGIPDAGLCEIYNLADLYVQYSIAGALEMPIAEAKACGIPAIATDYAAMSEQVKSFGCSPIKVAKLFYEPIIETEQIRALPDNDDCADKIIQFFEMPFVNRLKASYEVRQDAIDNYSFDQAYKIFEEAIDNVDISTNKLWNDQITILEPKMPPQSLTNSQLVDWCILNILKNPKLLSSYFRNFMIKSLNAGYMVERSGRGPFDASAFVSIVNKMAENKNYWEKFRVSKFDTNNSNKLSFELV